MFPRPSKPTWPLAKSLSLTSAWLALTGCAFHPVDPAPLPSRGGAPLAVAVAPPAPPANQEPWWSEFDQPELDALIRRALADNQDVVAARERIRQALAQQARTAAPLWPQLDLELSADKEIYADGRARQGGVKNSAGLSAAWKLDPFGKTRQSARARSSEARASAEESETFRLALSASVADTYFGIVGQKRLLALLDEQSASAGELLRLIEQRFREGLISQVDVLQQQSQTAELESQIPVAQAELAELETKLGALLAATPGDPLVAGVGMAAKIPAPPPLGPVPKVDELLFRRPDLRAARARLVAADEDTGAALAARLPSLTLGADALHVDGRGAPVSTITLGADLVQPLLDWGALRAEWLRAKSRYLERLATFSQAYLDAAWRLDGLARGEARQRDLLSSLERRRAILEKTIRQARNRYDAGLTDYLPVLTANQQLYALDQRLVRENRRLVSLRIALHQALGGHMPAEQPVRLASR